MSMCRITCWLKHFLSVDIINNSVHFLSGRCVVSIRVWNTQRSDDRQNNGRMQHQQLNSTWCRTHGDTLLLDPASSPAMVKVRFFITLCVGCASAVYRCLVRFWRCDIENWSAATMIRFRDTMLDATTAEIPWRIRLGHTPTHTTLGVIGWRYFGSRHIKSQTFQEQWICFCRSLRFCFNNSFFGHKRKNGWMSQ